MKYNNAMKIKVDVKHIAKLAALNLDKSEEKKYEEQLESILGYVNKLQEVNTKNVRETSQTTGLKNVSKKDVPSSSLSQNDSLNQAKRKQNEFFLVKGILDNE